MSIPAKCKIRIREALKGNWLTALLIALTVNLPSLLVQGIAAFTGNDLTSRLLSLMESSLYSGGSAADSARLISGMREIRESGGVWAMQGLNLAAALVTPCLTLGMLAWLLGRLRKEEDPGVAAAFSRIGAFFRAVGLRLYTTWRVFLWMLPGIALSLAGIAVLLAAPASASEDSVWLIFTLYLGMEMGALALMLVFGVRAALKYALGDLILADRPETGPIQAAKESVRMVMQGRRGTLFGLYMSFFGWYAAVMAVSFLGGTSSPASVIGLMLQMLASLALSVYVNGTLAAFYLEIRETEQAGTAPEGALPENGNDEESD